MKKQSLLLIAGSILALASCNTETAGNAEADQAKVDSIVNARVEEIKMELQMKNDSIINAMAVWRADSIVAAMSGKKVDMAAKPKPRPSTTGPVQEEPAAAEKPRNSKEGRFDGKTDNTTKKEGRFDDKAAEKEKQQNTDKKADRFK